MSCWLPCSELLCECCWPCHWGHTASAARGGNCAPDWEPSGTGVQKRLRLQTSTTKDKEEEDEKKKKKKIPHTIYTQPTKTVVVEACTSIHLRVVCAAGGGGSSTCRHGSSTCWHLAKSVGRAAYKPSHGSKLWRHGLCRLGSHLLGRKVTEIS